MADEELSDDVELPGSDDIDDSPEEIEEDLDVDDAVVDVDDLDDDDAVVEDDEEDDAVVAPAPAPARTRRSSDEDEEEDEDDDVSDDDVEADLDTILKDRIAAQPDEDEDEEEGQPEPDDRSDGAGRIQPRRPGEFVCQSCFLLKHPSQLADADNMLCSDCV